MSNTLLPLLSSYPSFPSEIEAIMMDDNDWVGLDVKYLPISIDSFLPPFVVGKKVMKHGPPSSWHVTANLVISRLRGIYH